jgi:hypothetical protein
MKPCVAVQIETTTACNARCTFCFRATHPAKSQTMTDAVFEKIIRENAAGDYLLYLRGDPLCDAKIVERVAEIHRRYPKSIIFFHTNGGLLTEQLCEDLKHAGLTQLCISCYGVGEQHDKLQPPVKFDHIVEMMGILNMLHMPVYIVNNRVPGNEDSSIAKAFWKRFSYTVVSDSNLDWGDGLHATAKPSNANKCNSFYNHRLFLADGSFATCCIDYEGRNVFGNIMNETWEEGFERLRGMTLPFCDTCCFKYAFDKWRASK